MRGGRGGFHVKTTGMSDHLETMIKKKKKIEQESRFVGEAQICFHPSVVLNKLTGISHGDHFRLKHPKW